MSEIYNPSNAPFALVVLEARRTASRYEEARRTASRDEEDKIMRKIGWFDIYVEDMERAQTFYEKVLDTTLTSMDDPNDPSAQMRAFGDDFTSHGAGGALVKLDYTQPGPGGSMVYFSCEDCAVEEARVSAAGGAVVRPKFSIGDHGFVSLITDTEGNMVGLHSVAA